MGEAEGGAASFGLDRWGFLCLNYKKSQIILFS